MSHTNYGELWLHSDVQYNMILPHSHKMATAVLVLMQGRSEKKKQSLNLSEIKKCLPRAPSSLLGTFLQEVCHVAKPTCKGCWESDHLS